MSYMDELCSSCRPKAEAREREMAKYVTDTKDARTLFRWFHSEDPTAKKVKDFANRVVSGADAEPEGRSSNDPITSEIASIKSTLAALQESQQSAAFNTQLAKLKEKYPWATDEHFDRAYAYYPDTGERDAVPLEDAFLSQNREEVFKNMGAPAPKRESPLTPSYERPGQGEDPSATPSRSDVTDPYIVRQETEDRAWAKFQALEGMGGG